MAELADAAYVEALEREEERNADLEERVQQLEDENAICREAIEQALELVGTWADDDENDDDHSQGAARAQTRMLNEAIGKAVPRLLLERPGGQRLYGLLYRDLQARVRELEAALRLLVDLKDGPRDEMYYADKPLAWDAARAALAAVDAEKEGDPRLAFDGNDYCNLRNFISDSREEWTESGALTNGYFDELDEKVRQALIAHRAAVDAETP